MKVYPEEVLSGLSKQISESTHIVLEAEIISEPTISSEHPSESAIQKTLAKYGHSNPDQIDLYYLTSVLVSTGWNGNDDVFLWVHLYLEVY